MRIHVFMETSLWTRIIKAPKFDSKKSNAKQRYHYCQCMFPMTFSLFFYKHFLTNNQSSQFDRKNNQYKTEMLGLGLVVYCQYMFPMDCRFFFTRIFCMLLFPNTAYPHQEVFVYFSSCVFCSFFSYFLFFIFFCSSGPTEQLESTGYYNIIRCQRAAKKSFCRTHVKTRCMISSSPRHDRPTT